MTLISRVSLAGSRTGLSARSNFTRFKLADKVELSFSRNASTEAAQGGTGRAQQRLKSIGNVVLGSALVAGGVGTILFTYLRFKNAGFGIGVAANTIMDDGLHPAAYPWPNSHPFATFDHSRYLLLCVTRITIDHF
jgi:hypothetical protein